MVGAVLFTRAALWIPAYAGMTVRDARVTGGIAAFHGE